MRDLAWLEDDPVMLENMKLYWLIRAGYYILSGDRYTA